MNIRFESVNQGNRDTCAALEVEAHQRPHIASNLRSLEQAAANRAAVPLLVLRDDQPVGFLMYEPRGTAVVSLHRFMIDRRYQRQGIGLSAMERLIERFQAEGFLTIYLSFRPENDAARSFYDRLGFLKHEIEPDGEVVYRRGLPREIATDKQ
jgi:diamine N-acetyltransferase